MPVMNGLEALAEIHAIRPDVPVIVSSGLGDAEVERTFAGRSVAAFLSKPYTVKQLAREIKKYMPAQPA